MTEEEETPGLVAYGTMTGVVVVAGEEEIPDLVACEKMTGAAVAVEQVAVVSSFFFWISTEERRVPEAEYQFLSEN